MDTIMMGYFKAWASMYASLEKEPFNIVTNISIDMLASGVETASDEMVDDMFKAHTLYGIVKNKAKDISLNIDSQAVAIIAQLPNINTKERGEMLTCFLKNLQLEKEGDIINPTVIRDVFKGESPTDRALNVWWEAQKVNGKSILNQLEF